MSASNRDAECVRHVLANRNNYHEILGRAEGQELQRNYKKKCLLLHPDKNKDSRAEEAFKVLREAYETLSDPAKRSAYERHGAEGVRRMESTGSPYAQGQYYRRRRPPQEFGFEDLFGQAFPQHRHRRGNNVHEFEANGNLLMALPVLFFFLMALLLQTVSLGDTTSYRQSGGRGQYNAYSTPVFSLKEEGEYLHQRETDVAQFPELRVRYYVTRHFYDQMRLKRTTLRTVEIEVLKTHRDYLQRRCVSERVAGRRSQPSCVQLEKYRGIP